MGEFSNNVEGFSRNTREYVDLKIDDLKLKTVKGLSITLGRFLWMLLLLLVISVVLLALAVGVMALLGNILGSFALAAFAVAGFFALIGLVIFLLRKRLFTDSFIKLFINLFFGEDDGEL